MRGLAASGSAQDHTFRTLQSLPACCKDARQSLQAPLHFVLDLGSLHAGAVQLQFNPAAVSAVPAVACGTRLGLVGLIPGLGCRCWLVLLRVGQACACKPPSCFLMFV